MEIWRFSRFPEIALIISILAFIILVPIMWFLEQAFLLFPEPHTRGHLPFLRFLSEFHYHVPLSPAESDMLLSIIFNQRVHDRYLGRQAPWKILWDSFAINPRFPSTQEQINHLAIRFERMGEAIMKYDPPVSFFNSNIRFPGVILPEDLPTSPLDSETESSDSDSDSN